MASGSSAVLLFILFHHWCLTKFSAHQRDLSSTNVRTFHQYVPPNSTYYISSDSLEISSDIDLCAIDSFDRLNNNTKRAICELCRLLLLKNSFYNVSPQR